MNTCSTTVQLGPDFRCFDCGTPATGGQYWLPCRSPLDAYAQHIFYLRLPCGHNPRAVRLGDAITPLAFVRLPDFKAQIAANSAAIELGLTVLREAQPAPAHA